MKIWTPLVCSTAIAFQFPAIAGQTGAFATVKNAMWACEDEQSLAEIMTKRTAAEMKAEAERSGRCIRLKAGTQIWTQGGNDVIEFGGIEGYPESLYYPAVGVSYD